MRTYSFSAIALLACVAASSRSTSEGPITSSQHEPQRFLRDVAEANQEEREIISLPGIDKAIGFIKKWVPKLTPKFLMLMATRASAEDAFASLKLTPENNLLSTPQFEEWATYVRWRAKDDPDAAAVDMAAVLVEKYGELNLVRMLDSSRKVDDTKDIAIRVQHEQLKKWVLDESFSGFHLFHIIGLNGIGLDNFLTSPAFNIWVKYAKLSIAYDKSYKDQLLYQILKTAMMNDNTKNMAKELLIQLNELHPKEVKPLKLSDSNKGEGWDLIKPRYSVFTM